MKFELTDEQTGFGAALGDLLARAGTVDAARAWADGDSAPGLAIWKRLADQGVSALVVPESDGGLGGTPIDLVVAHEVLGHHLAVGPWIESSAYLATALVGDRRGAIAAGSVATVAVPPQVPYALDGDVAEAVYLVDDSELFSAEVSEVIGSVDSTRRLARVSGNPAASFGRAGGDAFDTAVLACAAQLLGAGERLLADSVGYAKQRRQFGREIGSYQAIKHQLADVRIALDFVRPLIYGAALSLGTPDGPRDVSAAKVAAADAAYLAARTGLQVHGAIGYTREFDLGLWINRVQALVTAWGTPAYHRGRVLAALVATGSARPDLGA